jgi:hypothetical protein
VQSLEIHSKSDGVQQPGSLKVDEKEALNLAAGACWLPQSEGFVGTQQAEW